MSYIPTQDSPIFCFYSSTNQSLVATSDTTTYSSDSTDYALNQKFAINQKIGTGEISNTTDFVLHTDAHIMADVRTSVISGSIYEIINSIRFLDNNTQIGTAGQDSCVREDITSARVDEFAKAKVKSLSNLSLEFYYTRGETNMRGDGLFAIEKQSMIFGILT